MISRPTSDNGAALVLGGIGAFALAGLAARRGSGNTFQTVAQVREKNRQRGGSFFAKSVMDRFNSKVETPRILPGGYFVTSEKFYATGGETYSRRFTVRRAMEDGAVQTVGTFMEFASKQQAVQAAQGLSD